jgi:hypothetical protein
MDYPLGSMMHLAKKYGPIYKLSLAGLDLIIVSNWELVHEVCDDSRFKKSIKGDLEVCLSYPTQSPRLYLAVDLSYDIRSCELPCMMVSSQ